MNKKKKIIIMIIIAAALLIPVKSCYKDGGTVTYTAVLYKVTKQHSIVIEENQSGYDTGTKIRILCFEIYNDVKFVPRIADSIIYDKILL
ncbi:MAG: hypothetical protein Q4F95_01110 [Oscillospiraceae bacterium]|nr:hypothetical protein [Oscillospiraceae bacterium]